MKINRWKPCVFVGSAIIAGLVGVMSTGSTSVVPQPHGPTGTWRLLWADYFPGDHLDRTKWTTPLWHVQNVDTDPENVWVYNSKLVLNLSAPDRGALVRSTFEFRPGMVAEAMVKFPGDDAGDPIFNFPAWWASGDYVNGKTPSGEHDIAEGLRNGLKITYWDANRSQGYGRYPPGDWNNRFHYFTLYRLTASAIVYWDGIEVGRYPTNDDGGAERLLLSLGSPSAAWGQPTILGKPSRVFVENVKVWSK